MALVTHLERDEREMRSVHPTTLVARYSTGEPDGTRRLRINSYGSADRAVGDKLSQTLQFDERSARRPFDVLKTEFGF